MSGIIREMRHHLHKNKKGKKVKQAVSSESFIQKSENLNTMDMDMEMEEPNHPQLTNHLDELLPTPDVQVKTTPPDMPAKEDDQLLGNLQNK